MTRSERLEPRLPELLAELSAPRLPDYTDDLLARTAALRQRPRWTFPERWLPMGVLARSTVLVPRPPWRLLFIGALLVALLAAALVWVGSRPRVPAPFGPAGNGLVLYSTGGDLHTWDPATGRSIAIVTGAAEDITGAFSRDGQRIAFLRLVPSTTSSDAERISINVAAADGSGVIDLTGPLEAPDWWEWSASGDELVYQALADGVPTLHVVAADGSSPPRALSLGMAATVPAWLPPSGRELVFRGVTDTADGERSALFAVDPTGGEPRALSPVDGDPGLGYRDPVVAPDGSSVVFDSIDPVTRFRSMHLLDLASGRIRPLSFIEGEAVEGAPRFSPDSRFIAFRSFAGSGWRLAIAPVDGTAEARFLTDTISGDAWHEFSPDGTKILVTLFGVGTMLIDVASGTTESFPTSVVDPAGWQRRP